ncbi:MAG: VCBS repeat-containing protein [Gammaproteobacteria bacterium]|nr:VCBS repeat-containing protein [Gammaproteobacteria bacterium]
MRVIAALSTLLVTLTSCGGGGGGSPSSQATLSSPYLSSDQSSHALQATDIHVSRHGIRSKNPNTFAHAIAYADFDQDGDTDVFVSGGDTTRNQTSSELYLNDGNGNFSYDNRFFNGEPPGLVHPRKAITGDFNGDGKPDIFVAGHGYDRADFPGESPVLITSSPNGLTLGQTFPELVDFYHSAASADIDGDQDLDIYLGDPGNAVFLINNGSGQFSVTKENLRISSSGYYTAELFDVDKDSYVDLLLAGHEQDGAITRIYWGSANAVFDVNNSSVLPSIASYGTVVDIDAGDLDGDGDYDLVLSRTGDGKGEYDFYQGYYVQVLEATAVRTFEDITTQAAPTLRGTAERTWIDWLRLQDYNKDGHIDIFADDAARNLIWLNDGSGNFK